MSISITIPLVQTPPSTDAAPRGDASPKAERFETTLEREEESPSTSPTPMRTPRPETQAGQDTATSKEPSERERDVREDAPKTAKKETHVDVASGAEAQSATTAWTPLATGNIPMPVVPNEGTVPDTHATSAATADGAEAIPSDAHATPRSITTVIPATTSIGAPAAKTAEPLMPTAPEPQPTSVASDAATTIDASVTTSAGSTHRKPETTQAAPVSVTPATTVTTPPSPPTHAAPPSTAKPVEHRTEASRSRSKLESGTSSVAVEGVTETPISAVTEVATSQTSRRDDRATTPSNDAAAPDAESSSPVVPTATPSATTIGARPPTPPTATAGSVPERGATPTNARGDVAVETNVQTTPASRMTVDLATRRVEERLEASKGPGPGTFDKILESLRGELKTHADRITLRLDPAELGKVEVRLLARGDAVTVRVAADRDDVADLLRRDQSALHKVLAEAGVNVAHLDVRAGLDQGARHELWERASAAAVATPSYPKPKPTGSTSTRTSVRVEGRLDLLA